MDGSPEAISASYEVITKRCRRKTWIDAAKHDPQIRRKDIS
jgi:hypothetical protein